MSEDVKAVVRERYREAALRAGEVAGVQSCCGGPVAACCAGGAVTAPNPITRDLYDATTTSSLPEAAVLASLGCGNPTALADLGAGEVVLDLGSGGGIDVLLSARRVGPAGKVYGLDMTDEMLDLARRNAAAAGALPGGAVASGAGGEVGEWGGGSVEFLKGEMESIPLPDESVDVVISNCVINLSVDKRRVLGEVFRVLKPGGRLAVADVVVRGEVPPEVRRSMELWVGCVAGALEEREFESLLREVGFEAPSVEPTRIYDPEEARAVVLDAGLDPDAFTAAVEGRFMAAFIRARKGGLEVSYRVAEPGDLAAVEGLLRRCQLPTEGVAEALGGFVVAESGTRVVGVAGLEVHGEDGVLRSVAVDPTARSSGIGGALTARVLAAAREAGLDRIYLLTTTAAEYFPRWGFRRIARADASTAVQDSVEFSAVCPASAVVMVLDLASGA